jgi:succinylglutamate desuccinylase
MAPQAEFADLPRLLGKYETGRPGPQVMICAGIHGNEPAGVRACLRVLEKLRRLQLPLRGRFTALAGNLGALRADRRYVEQDLNRRWSPSTIDELLAKDPATDRIEEREQRELLAHFRPGLDDPGAAPSVFIDLHSFSAPGPPFTVMADTLRNRQVAFALPIPLILGLEEAIDGTLLEFLAEEGQIALAVEGGQHKDPRTVDHHEAVVFLALVAAGALLPEEIADLPRYRTLLEQAATGTPSVVEVRHRHAIVPEDRFIMRPGFRNFDPVQRGQELADQHDGVVKSPRSGLILMPLYQELGEEGFLIARPIYRLWLHISAILRAIHLDRIVTYLPGVQRHPTRSRAFLVNPHVALFLVREIFHLLGFHRAKPEGDRLVFIRRRPD